MFPGLMKDDTSAAFLVLEHHQKAGFMSDVRLKLYLLISMAGLHRERNVTLTIRFLLFGLYENVYVIKITLKLFVLSRKKCTCNYIYKVVPLQHILQQRPCQMTPVTILS